MRGLMPLKRGTMMQVSRVHQYIRGWSGFKRGKTVHASPAVRVQIVARGVSDKRAGIVA